MKPTLNDLSIGRAAGIYLLGAQKTAPSTPWRSPGNAPVSDPALTFDLTPAVTPDRLKN